MSELIVTQVLAFGRAYGYISLVACLLVLVWAACSYLLDLVDSPFFHPPAPASGSVWPEERRQQLRATVVAEQVH